VPFRGFKKGLVGLRIGHVDGTKGGSDFLGDLLTLVSAATSKEVPGSSIAQCLGHFDSKAAGGSSDDNVLSGKTHDNVFLFAFAF
jgi:hypothetical protein